MEIYFFNIKQVYLKVKIKSLAAEARIIRKEERKALERDNKTLYWSLNKHRTEDVREEARATQLAYAIIRGRKYRDVEPTAAPIRDFEFERLAVRVTHMVQKYGRDRTFGRDDLKNWMGRK